MKLDLLTCPACGAAIKDSISPYRQIKCPACGSALVLAEADENAPTPCPQCDTLNDPLTRYCQKCGMLLRVDCPYCYQSNPIEVMFCKVCGANLPKARQREQAWLAEKQKHEAERRAAFEQAESQSRAASLNRLIEKLDEPADHSFAIYCLQQYGAYAVDPLLVVLRTDDDPDARFGAAHALGLIGDRRAIPALLEALADSEPAVRYWAAEALGKLRAEHAVDALSKLLKDRHKGVRASAVTALQQIGTPAALDALN
jgi:hypothetical protein